MSSIESEYPKHGLGYPLTFLFVIFYICKNPRVGIHMIYEAVSMVVKTVMWIVKTILAASGEHRQNVLVAVVAAVSTINKLNYHSLK